MFKKFRKLTSILVAVLMLAASFASLAPVKVYAAPKATVYVALGDSVSFGMSATPGYGYTVLLKTYLDGKGNKSETPTMYTNLSVPGYTAEDLYHLVTDGSYAATIAEADLITVNIGGNNLLQPVIGLVQSLYPSAATVEELNAAIYANPYPLLALLQKLQDPASPESLGIHGAFAAGVASFSLYWPLMIKEVRKLAPKAEIFVNTLYSPVPQDQTFNMLLNPYLQAINLSINTLRYRYSYEVVDVYSAFASQTQQVVDFNITSPPFNVDIHPNDAGHLLIFNTLKEKLRTTAPRYYYK